MENKSNIFQTVILIILGAIVVIASLMFAGILPGGISMFQKTKPTVVLWGTVNSDQIGKFFDAFNKDAAGTVNITYVAKNPETYNADLIDALASGNGPDLFFVDQGSLYQFADKINPIPFSVYPLRTYQNTFIDGTNIFLADNSIAALPIYGDPLVMYYNRDMYSGAGVASTPKLWSDFVALPKKINNIDSRNNVTQSAAALGTFSNIKNAKAVLSALIMQAGNPIVERQTGDIYKVTLADSMGYDPAPAIAASSFFSQFADPANSNYCWNKSLPEAEDAFAAGTIATYFGFASELSDLRDKNPNLNLDVAPIPARSANGNLTYGLIYGLAISKGSKDQNSALTAAMSLVTAANAGSLAQLFFGVTIRRDLLGQGSTDPFQSVYDNAAITMHTWVDPDPTTSNDIFARIIDSEQSGEMNGNGSIARANGDLLALFKRNQANQDKLIQVDAN